MALPESASISFATCGFARRIKKKRAPTCAGPLNGRGIAGYVPNRSCGCEPWGIAPRRTYML